MTAALLSPPPSPARRIAAARGDYPRDETVLARHVAELLHRAGTGPAPADRAVIRAAARARAAASTPLRPSDTQPVVPLPAAPDGPGEAPGRVLPFGVFDSDAEGDYG